MELKKSESIKNLAVALCDLQTSLKAVKKDGKNPFFKSKYATLENVWDAVRSPLYRNGLSISQFPCGESGLTTILMHTSGEWLECATTMEPKDKSPQGQGSAITYMRRYALSAILGVVSEEDDDGNAASQPSKATTKEAVHESTLCDNAGCKGKAKPPFKLCYACNSIVKNGGKIPNRRSEGAVSEEEVPFL